jgi:hypothetical protein
MITPNAGLPLPEVNPRAISTSTRQRVQTVQHHNSSRFPAYSRGKKRLFLAYFILIIFFLYFHKKIFELLGFILLCENPEGTKPSKNYFSM